MTVYELINLLADEDPGAEVYVSERQEEKFWMDVQYYSRENGTTQLPVKTVILMGNLHNRGKRK